MSTGASSVVYLWKHLLLKEPLCMGSNDLQ